MSPARKDSALDWAKVLVPTLATLGGLWLAHSADSGQLDAVSMATRVRDSIAAEMREAVAADASERQAAQYRSLVYRLERVECNLGTREC